ncbi:MAG: hypothetical protein ACOY5F_02120 [Pseudomonadota bacterium]
MNRSTLLTQAARGQIPVTLNGTPRPISRAQATVLKLAAKAHAGDPLALFRLLSLIDRLDRRRR